MYKKILVPLDGSKRAEVILPHVENLALNYKAKVVFMRVVESTYFAPDFADSVDISGYTDEYKRRDREAETYLNGLRGEFREKGIEAGIVVAHGSVVQSILDAAEQEDTGLIAIASHGRTGLSRAFYGSVAAGVLNRADRPLLIIRSRRAD
ncbi:universal stress protein [Desulfonema ishimotonii]|uniref:Universal stress protein n=1 Tax=Desulfonema ishimotonii TaxID=45657 RepID=A0A401FXN8_9BACT|nr:universal stress protein [Desulfonema ishimotonii]GBC61704.1 universal stress protein [Desulfonema ishimotonii]